MADRHAEPTPNRPQPPPANRDAHAAHTLIKGLHAHRPRLIAVAAGFAHASVGAEDIVQNAFAAAYEVRHTLEDTDAIDSWLAGFVRNVGAQEARKDARQSALLEAYGETAPVAESSPSEDAMLVKVDVRRAITELPEIQRAVVICRWFLGMSHKETAESVGRPEGTVRSDLFRAHAALRKKLRELRRT